MTSKQQQLEGNFRFHHSRLLMHAEEIAFYRGWDRERFLVNQAFDRLYQHCSTLFWKQALVGVFDAWLVKYGATMVGYAGTPFFFFFLTNNISHSTTTKQLCNTQLWLFPFLEASASRQ